MTESRILSLKNKKEKLDTDIQNERKRPSRDNGLIDALKKQKLMIKEEITRLEEDLAAA